MRAFLVTPQWFAQIVARRVGADWVALDGTGWQP